jgi:hypothetical protein
MIRCSSETFNSSRDNSGVFVERRPVVYSVFYNMKQSPREYFLKAISEDKFNPRIVYFTYVI